VIPGTYLGFHLLFVAPPIALLAFAAYRRPATNARAVLPGTTAIVLLAVLYTTPWDNVLIERGVWEYGEGVTSVHLWAAPLGEYLFFVLQPVLVALWLSNFEVPTGADLSVSARARTAGLAAGLAVTAVGIGLLLVGPSTLYLGAIAAWGGPILAIQWAFGWPQLLRARRAVTLGIAAPTAYLWLLDRGAIAGGLWCISERYTVGVAPLGLPLEEALFFLVTNVFIVQGLVLYLWLADRWPTVAAGVRTAVPPPAAAAPEPSPKPAAAAETRPEEADDDRDRATT
jgi:lycopene cyclase domain-containing protein